jgi:hypothetical protein
MGFACTGAVCARAAAAIAPRAVGKMKLFIPLPQHEIAV